MNIASVKMVPWSELPVELLEAVEDNVILYVDKVRLCSVCAPWRSALTKLPQPRLHQTPCLLLQYDDNNVATCGLFSPLYKKFYQLELPELAEGKLFKGSSHGWVVTLGDSPSLCLSNPLTRAQLKLPPRSSFPDVVKYRSDKINNEYALRYAYDRNAFYTLDGRHVRNFLTKKIVLSESDDYLAVAIYGEFGRLAYCRKGYKKWVHLHGDQCPYEEVKFFRGLLYALNCSRKLLICEVGACPKVTKIIDLSRTTLGDNMAYLVENSGALLMVERYRRRCQTTRKHKTNSFRIFKLDDVAHGFPSLIEVKDLGGDALFLGLNLSSSISCGDFPDCRGNCIYFTDDSDDIIGQEGIQGVDFDMGIYDLNDGNIETLSVPGYKCEGKNFWPPPIWVMPKTY